MVEPESRAHIEVWPLLRDGALLAGVPGQGKSHAAAWFAVQHALDGPGTPRPEHVRSSGGEQA